MCYDRLGKLIVTDRIEKAEKFPTVTKAVNSLNNQLSKKKRNGWTIEELPLRANLDMDNIIEMEGFNWNSINSAIIAFSKLNDYIKKQQLKLKEVDSELCDCYHACEFFNFNAAKGYKLSKMIKDRRIYRRFLKDEIWKANIVLNLPIEEMTSDGTKLLFDEVNNQAYKPRVLNELFES